MVLTLVNFFNLFMVKFMQKKLIKCLPYLLIIGAWVWFAWTTDLQPPKRELPVPTQKELTQISCIAHAVYHESRGEPPVGQLAVAYVIRNRLDSDKFPNNACGVVYAPKQFTNIRKTKPLKYTQEWRMAMAVAQAAYWRLTPDPTGGAEYFYAPSKVNPRWAHKQVASVDIGNHRFFGLP